MWGGSNLYLPVYRSLHHLSIYLFIFYHNLDIPCNLRLFLFISFLSYFIRYWIIYLYSSLSLSFYIWFKFFFHFWYIFIYPFTDQNYLIMDRRRLYLLLLPVRLIIYSSISLSISGYNWQIAFNSLFFFFFFFFILIHITFFKWRRLYLPTFILIFFYILAIILSFH